MVYSMLTAAAPADAGLLGGASMFMPLILIIGVMYFFMIRPQNKKQKELQKMLDALKKGDKVVTIGGIHGTVSSVKENTVVVKVDDSAKIEFDRKAIAAVISDKKNKEDKAGSAAESGEKKDE